MILKDSIILSFFILFLFFLIIKILSSLKKNTFLNYFSTPVIMLSIIMISLYNLKNNPENYNLFITSGLILSIIGDMFNLIEKPDNSHLLYSIFFFFFTHIIYTLAFLIKYTFSLYHIFILILFIVLIIFIYSKFKININSNSMKIGIPIYMLVITITLIIAIGNLNYKPINKSLFIITGMFFFWLSDLFLGINAFIKKLKYSTVIIWVFYASGQLLIGLSTYFYM